MVDPFESLRHDAESTGSTAIDPRFRADLLAEAHRRLSSEPSTDSIRPRATADTPTPIPMEPIPMLAKQPKKTRPILLAAACVALVAAGVITVAALRAEDDRPAAPSDTIPSTTLATTPPPATPTTQPSTTLTSVSASTERSSDDEIADVMLLPSEEYAPDWHKSGTTSFGVGFDPTVAGQIPDCASFVGPVFDVMAASSHHTRVWYHLYPPALYPQHVVVLPDAATAQSMFGVINSADFGRCAAAYNAVRWQTTSEGLRVGFPLPNEFDQPISEPPGGAVGDTLAFRRYEVTWTDDQGYAHDDLVSEAVLRVDRALIFIGTLNSEDGVGVVSEGQFHDMLERVVSRAASVLDGTIPHADDSEIADAVLLSGDEYGPGWTRSPNGWILPTMDSAIAGEIPECAPFVDSVFGAAEQGASTFRTFWHLAQPEAFSTQYVAVFPDAAVARSVYELVNSTSFATCASAYGTVLSGGQSPGSFPSPVDQPITDPPFEPIGDLLTYRTFPHTWRTADGTEVGPQTEIDAVMLVGRTITFIGTVTEGEGGVVLNTTDQFRTALEHIVERTNTALAGDPNP